VGGDLEMDAEVGDAQEGLLDVDNFPLKATPGLFYNSATGQGELAVKPSVPETACKGRYPKQKSSGMFKAEIVRDIQSRNRRGVYSNLPRANWSIQCLFASSWCVAIHVVVTGVSCCSQLLVLQKLVSSSAEGLGFRALKYVLI
jgi:hypothetical protein